MTTRWLEIRVSLEKDDPTPEVISSTFQKVTLPLYKFINSFPYIKRGNYLTEQHSVQDSKTPFVWMVRWEVENWEQNSSELKSKESKFLGSDFYIFSFILSLIKIKFKEIVL